MPEIFKKIAQYAFFGVFTLAFAWVCGQLFFEKQTNSMMTSVTSFFAATKQKNLHAADVLNVMYASEPVAGMDPTNNNQTARQRLINMYEPLVSLDSDLNPRATLALSWGLIDDFTWSFTLRPGVKFHDGSSLDAQDVVASLDRAMNLPESALKGILSSIEKIEIVDDMTVRIRTHKPDPLLLQRLSLVLIFPLELKDKDSLGGIGTGPYEFVSWNDGEPMILKRFDGYWGAKPKFAQVNLMAESDKSQRVNAFLAGAADVLEFVPPDAVDAVKNNGFKMVETPGLEVQFLLFNTKSELLKNAESRQSVSLAIDQDAIVKALGFNTRPVSQFVSNGVFGFNPDVAKHNFDLKKAEELAAKSGLKGKTLSFHLLPELGVLGEQVRTDLQAIGVNAVISYMDMDKLLASTKAADADIYFFGFKSDVGDSSDFLDTMVRSQGSFNFLHYLNPGVDKLIEGGLTEMKPAARLKDLQEAMRILMEKDFVGVPLFEYELYYAFDDKVAMQPRIDGYLYFDELTVK